MQITSITGTNLITNPNFTTNTAGWSGSSSTISVDSTTYFQAPSSLKIVGGASAAIATYAYTYTTGTQYAAQLRVKGAAGKVVFLSSSSNGSSSSITLTGGWDLLTWIFTPTTATSTLEVHCSSASTTLNIDCVMLQQASVINTYFDGNSGNGYVWTGTTNASTSTYSSFIDLATSNAQDPDYATSIAWTKQLSSNVSFFTIGTSAIGGDDIIPGTQTYPTYFNQYQYMDASTYLLSASVTKNIGQYPYGMFSAQHTVELDNTDLTFLPGQDPTIGNYIITGRPVQFAIGYGGEFINLFVGTSTRPQNDLQNRTITLTAFDGTDYIRNFTSQGKGPLALANNGVYANVRADLVIADLLTEAGFTSTQYVLEQSLQPETIGYLSPIGLTLGTIIQSICEAEGGIFFSDEYGVAYFWNHQHTATYNAIRWSFDYSQIINFTLEDTPIINDVVVTAKPRAAQAKQLIWQLTSATAIPNATNTTSYTNLITNPSFSNGITGWSTQFGATIAASSVRSYAGTGSLQITNSASITSGQYGGATISQTGLTSGSTYTISAYVYSNTAANTVKLSVNNTGASNTSTVVGIGWTRIVLTFAASATSHSITLASSKVSAVWFVDAVMLTLTSGAVAYFDGDTTDTTSYIYTWNGTGNASTSTATPVGYVTVQADFQDLYGAMPVLSVDTPVYVTSATTSNYTTNLAQDGSGTAQNASVQVISTQLVGSTYYVTFGNTYTQPVYITAMSLYGIPTKVTNVIDVEYTDPTSIATYGINPSNNGLPITINNDLIQDESTAYSNAYSLVNNYSNAYSRMTVDVFAAPQLQFGDYVAVTLNDTGQTQDYIIVGITNGVTNDGEFTQTLELEIRRIVTYFTINVSAIDGDDVISP